MAHSTLTSEQALALYWTVQFTCEHGGLLPKPDELASLTHQTPAQAAASRVELTRLGLFTNGHGLNTFNTRAAAMYHDEAAVIAIVKNLFTAHGRGEVTKRLMVEFVARFRYPEISEARIHGLLASAVRMGYLNVDRGAYGCTVQVVEHGEYLELLLHPPST